MPRRWCRCGTGRNVEGEYLVIASIVNSPASNDARIEAASAGHDISRAAAIENDSAGFTVIPAQTIVGTGSPDDNVIDTVSRRNEWCGPSARADAPTGRDCGWIGGCDSEGSQCSTGRTK